MIKILFIISFLSFNLYASKCIDLANHLINSGKKVQLFYFPETKLSYATIEAEYKSIKVGFINFSEHRDSLYIDLVKTNSNFRREGVQTALIQRLVQLKNPKKISLTFGETNKKVFLSAMFDELFHHMVDIEYKADLAEVYIIENIRMINVNRLKTAVFKTPTGKALYAEGFTKVSATLGLYPINGHNNLSILLDFSKKE